MESARVYQHLVKGACSYTLFSALEMRLAYRSGFKLPTTHPFDKKMIFEKLAYQEFRKLFMKEYREI